MAQNAWRTGFCDAIFNRECKSPWVNAGWLQMWRHNQYLAGYIAGQEDLKQQLGKE